MRDDAKEGRIREIDGPVAELDVMLEKFRKSNNGGSGNVLSAHAMIYWADHKLERNTLPAERYRLTKKSAGLEHKDELGSVALSLRRSAFLNSPDGVRGIDFRY